MGVPTRKNYPAYIRKLRLILHQKATRTRHKVRISIKERLLPQGPLFISHFQDNNWSYLSEEEPADK